MLLCSAAKPLVCLLAPTKQTRAGVPYISGPKMKVSVLVPIKADNTDQTVQGVCHPSMIHARQCHFLVAHRCCCGHGSGKHLAGSPRAASSPPPPPPPPPPRLHQDHLHPTRTTMADSGSPSPIFTAVAYAPTPSSTPSPSKSTISPTQRTHHQAHPRSLVWFSRSCPCRIPVRCLSHCFHRKIAPQPRVWAVRNQPRHAGELAYCHARLGVYWFAGQFRAVAG
jgi:hypothetical protein